MSRRTGIATGLVLVLGYAGLAVTLTGQTPASTDWPQWRGPDRNGISRERGLLKQWPAGGPAKLWSTGKLGGGYGSVAVAGERIFLQGMVGRDSVISSLNRADGKLLWTKVLSSAGDNDRGPGPRATPTVDGDRVYVLTEQGDLSCLRATDGSPVWQRNILRDFGGRNISWLISESPLVDGPNVIVTPGGKGASLVSLDKMTGKTVWTTKELSDEAGYASPVVADIQGVRTVMTITGEAGVGVRVSDGKLMWRYSRVANNTANVSTPVFFDNKVFYSSAYDTGAALLGLAAQGGQVSAKEIYFTREMQNHHGGVVLVDGYLYGFHNAILACLEFATGKTMWRNRSVGKGSITYADGNLYLVGEDNAVGLAEATPAGYQERGRFRLEDEGWPTWAHPVVSGGRLYIRNQNTLTSYDVRAR